MYRGSGPRVLPIIIIVLVVALVIAALVSVGRMFFASSDTQSQSQHDGIQAALLNTSDDRGVRWTVRGPLVADEKFQSYQITVTPSSRTYTVYSGYLDQVVSNQSYGNNLKAYEQFVYALNKSGVNSVRSSTDGDIRGVCATQGLAFVFETVKSSTADNSQWTSTCNGSKGTMSAKTDQVQALFVNQIPDFSPRFDKIY